MAIPFLLILGLSTPAHAQQDSITRYGFSRGDSAAPLSVIEFGDFGCAYCRRFAAETFPSVDTMFVQTGRVYWTFVPIVLGPYRHAKRAAMAALCTAEQGAFYEMHDELYANQRRWQRTRNPRDRFTELVGNLGLDADVFAACYERDDIEDRVEAITKFAKRFPIPGTPAFLVGDRWIYGALPLDQFESVLLAQLEGR